MSHHFNLRHRYEVNPDFVSKFEAAGMKFVGQDEKNVRMEVSALLLCYQFHIVNLFPTTFMTFKWDMIGTVEKCYQEGSDCLLGRSHMGIMSIMTKQILTNQIAAWTQMTQYSVSNLYRQYSGLGQ